MEYYDTDELQTGLGRRGYAGISHVYIGTPNQRGHGIGSFLGGLFRRVLPLLRKGATAVGKEAIRTSANIAGDMLKKDISLKDAFRTRVRESGGNLKRKAEEKIETLMRGSGYKTAKIARIGHSSSGRVARRISPKKKRIKKKKRTRNNTIKKKTRRRRKKRKIHRTVADIFA